MEGRREAASGGLSFTLNAGGDASKGIGKRTTARCRQQLRLAWLIGRHLGDQNEVNRLKDVVRTLIDLRFDTTEGEHASFGCEVKTGSTVPVDGVDQRFAAWVSNGLAVPHQLRSTRAAHQNHADQRIGAIRLREHR